jgi:hypothetical protein
MNLGLYKSFSKYFPLHSTMQQKLIKIFHHIFQYKKQIPQVNSIHACFARKIPLLNYEFISKLIPLYWKILQTWFNKYNL